MKKIMGDPGHGGKFRGAVFSGVEEADINLAVSAFMGKALIERGHDFMMTRDDDYHLAETVGSDLEYRCQAEHIYEPDCFISIHCNGFAKDERVDGIEVFTSPGLTKADALATSVIDALKSSDEFSDRDYREDFSDFDADKEARFKVLVDTRSPAILIELGFLSNLQERKWLKSPFVQQEFGSVIAAGVDAWLTKEDAVAGLPDKGV